MTHDNMGRQRGLQSKHICMAEVKERVRFEIQGRSKRRLGRGSCLSSSSPSKTLPLSLRDSWWKDPVLCWRTTAQNCVIFLDLFKKRQEAITQLIANKRQPAVCLLVSVWETVDVPPGDKNELRTRLRGSRVAPQETSPDAGPGGSCSAQFPVWRIRDCASVCSNSGGVPNLSQQPGHSPQGISTFIHSFIHLFRPSPLLPLTRRLSR